MALTLISGPEYEPLTIAKAKAQLRLDVDVDDDLIRDLILTAREWVEGQTQRNFVQQTWDYNIDYGWPHRNGWPRIMLPLNPVQSITSITYQDEAGTSPQPTLAASQYAVAARKYGSYIVPAYNVTWPSVRAMPNAITVRFVAGDSNNVPKPIERAMAMLVAHLYENREATAKALEEVPYGVEAMISPYRKGMVV